MRYKNPIKWLVLFAYIIMLFVTISQWNLYNYSFQQKYFATMKRHQQT